MPDRIITVRDFSGGLNTLADPATLPPHQSSDVMNVEILDSRSIRRRKGVSTVVGVDSAPMKALYRYYKDENGQIRPMIRPGMENTRKPGRRASQAEKDAYYVTLPAPVQVPAKPFLRPALSKMEAAMSAAREEIMKRIGAK